ncbi:hypothetical protein M5689_006950 [Euphorbia peplus]|nr:hypothetical protein M5689_006950 [Euphorbia peplus]
MLLLVEERNVITATKLFLCVHCDKSSHEKETCFKLNGYPEWFQEFKKKSKSIKLKANHVTTQFETLVDDFAEYSYDEGNTSCCWPFSWSYTR